MCKWGITEDILVFIPNYLSYTGEDRWAIKPIDKCIAPLVKKLNRIGIRTIASCCGHGQTTGTIILEDGRTIIVIGE